MTSKKRSHKPTRSNQYQGLMAVEDIAKNEVMIKVPSSVIINTKKAFYCPELRDLFYNNPDVFGKHTQDGEDEAVDA